MRLGVVGRMILGFILLNSVIAGCIGTLLYQQTRSSFDNENIVILNKNIGHEQNAVPQYISKETLLEDLWDVEKKNILITLCLLFIGGLMTAIFARQMSNPLLQISEAAKNYQEGELISLDIEDRQDEFGTLAKALGEMTQRITENNSEVIDRERRLFAILDTAVDGMVITNNRGIIDKINPSLEKMFGYSDNEMIGQNVSILMTNHEKKHHDGHLKRHKETGQSRILGVGRQETAVRKDGTTFPIFLSLSKFQVGEDTFFAGILRDITELKEKEELLQSAYDELENRVEDRTKELAIVTDNLIKEADEKNQVMDKLRLYARVFETATEGIVITDHKNRILDINPAFLDNTGYEREEAIGNTPAMNSSGRHDKAFYQEMWGTLAKEGRWQGEIWDKRKNGEIYPSWLTINAVKDEEGNATHYVGISVDITELKETKQQLEVLAYNDTLTGLPNRIMFNSLLEKELAKSSRNNSQLALLYIDLDRFKYVNDSLGHEFGDRLLSEVANRLKSALRKSDIVARLGGDEFTIILSDLNDAEISSSHVADSIIETISKPVYLDHHEVYVGASIGIAVSPDDGEEITTLTRSADMAMYHAKASGRNTYKFFEQEMNERAAQRLDLERELRRAIEQKEFTLHYQPKVDVHSGQILGAEALIRWIHPENGFISPDDFIPIAEETGLIIPIGEWVLEEASKQTKKWLDQFQLSEFKVAVNLSMRQFQQAETLIDVVKESLEKVDLDTRNFELEITESMMMSNVDNTTATLNQFRDMGLTISIDDFGTGHSSLSYLKIFPIQYLKIDRSFIMNTPDDKADASIVEATISMARVLELKVIAEGVETAEQLDMLKGMGCDQFQGYLFSRPLPVDDFSNLLAENFDQVSDEKLLEPA